MSEAKVVVSADTAPFAKDMQGLESAAAPAASKAAKAVSTAFSAEFNKTSSAAAALSGAVGGELGKIGSIANSVLKPLAEVTQGLSGASLAIAGIGGGAAIAVGGLVAVGFAARGLADGAVAAADRLEKLGLQVSDIERGNLDAYKAATKDLGIAMDELAVVAGGELAGDLAQVAAAAAGTIRAFVDAKDALEPYRDALDLIARAGLAVATLGATELGRAMLDSAAASNEAAVATDGLTDAERLEAEAKTDQIVGAWEQAKANKAAAEAAKAAADAAREQSAAAAAVNAGLADEAAARAYLTTTVDALTRATLSPQDQILADLEDQRSKILAAAAATEEWATANDALALAAAAAQRKLDAVNAAADRSAKQVASDAASASAAAARSLKEIETATKEYNAARVNAEVDAAAAIISSFGSIADSVVASYQARIDAGEELSAEEVRRANQAIDAAEAAAITVAGIQAAQVAISAVADLQAVGTPPPIAVPLGAAEGAALFAATVAGIHQHRPPDFTWTGDTGSGSNPAAADVPTAGGDDQGTVDKPTSGADIKDLAGASSRTGGGGPSSVLVGIDPRTQRLVVTNSGRPGKRPRVR